MSSQESRDAISRSEQLFCALEKKKLQGLLDMEIDDAFLNREHRCVSQVTLVVSLNPETFGRIQPLSQRALQQALDAVASLCVYSESVRGDKSQFNAFWMRVLSSGMMTWTRTRDLRSIHSILTSLRTAGLRISLTWQDQPLQPYVTEAIRAFIHSSRAKYERRDTLGGDGRCRPRVVCPLQVAIELSNCQLREIDIKRLTEVLRVRSDTPHAGAALCEREVLWRLRLARNHLDATLLNALAKLLESPSTRRIDSLGLIDATPRDVTQTTSKQYATAFKRVLVAAFRSKIAAHKDHGFALSLAGNGGLRPSHIVALHEALAGSGVARPLRAISFAGIYFDSDATWAQIGKLLFDSSAALAITMMDECQLTLSAAHGHASIAVGLAQLVRAARSQIIRALQDHVPVYCRVFGQTPATKELSRSTLYKVVAISTTNGLLLSVAVPRCSIGSFGSSGANAESVLVRSLTADEISCVRIGDTDIIRSRFTNPVLDAKHHRDPPNLRLLEAMGPDLKRLALRKYYLLYNFIAAVLACCPRVSELNLDYSQILEGVWTPVNHSRRAETLWTKLTTENWRSLQVLSLVGTDITSNGQRLAALKSVLADVPELALQHLCLGDPTTYDGERIRIVGDIIRQNRGLQEITLACSFHHFDLRQGGWYFESYTRCTKKYSNNPVRRGRIDQQLRVEGLSVESRLAFLSVLPRLSTALQQNIDNGVVAEIFKFADAKKARAVTWY